MEIPYTVTARRDTGLWNAKIGIWLFLASEVMLFGGLFSGYVFLRMGVIEGFDNPWPTRQLIVWPGFVNTLVLIASSVFVVFAWSELKLRNYRRYQGWMVGVLVCAAIFMCLKGFEYYGKFHHHGIKLQDDTVFEGVLKSDSIKFEATSLTLSLAPSRMDILGSLEGGEPRFKTPEGEEITLTRAWFRNYRNAAPADEGSVKLEAVKPLTFVFNPRKLRSKSDTAVTYRDSHVVEGKLVDDKIRFEVHDIDLRMVDDQEESMAWHYLGDRVEKEFFHHQESVLAAAKKRGVPAERLEANTMHLGVHGSSGAPDHGGGNGGGGEAAHGGNGNGGGGDGHGYPEIVIDRADKKFLSSHGPRYNTWYSIYFTLTGLHGLHVVGGALVLAYFLLFNGKLYRKDPEHLANRVEVGGLFWHFVDLVWIFLFPIMYLM